MTLRCWCFAYTVGTSLPVARWRLIGFHEFKEKVFGSRTMPRGMQLGPSELQAQLPQRHLCKDCDKWYGQEDDEYGPCMYKHLRKDKRYVTYGYHECDEPEELERRVNLWKARASEDSKIGTSTRPSP